jgi:hypothetical protein
MAENDRYIVTSFFKGPTLGYEKATSEYFIIWASETLSLWVRTLAFDLKGNLIFCSSDCYKVNLDIMMYTRTEKIEPSY